LEFRRVLFRSAGDRVVLFRRRGPRRLVSPALPSSDRSTQVCRGTRSTSLTRVRPIEGWPSKIQDCTEHTTTAPQGEAVLDRWRGAGLINLASGLGVNGITIWHCLCEYGLLKGGGTQAIRNRSGPRILRGSSPDRGADKQALCAQLDARWTRILSLGVIAVVA